MDWTTLDFRQYFKNHLLQWNFHSSLLLYTSTFIQDLNHQTAAETKSKLCLYVKLSKYSFLTCTGEPTSKCDIIRWKPGMDLTKKVPRKKKSKLEVKCFSFFTWFSDHLDAGNDEIADVRIKNLLCNFCAKISPNLRDWTRLVVVRQDSIFTWRIPTLYA